MAQPDINAIAKTILKLVLVSFVVGWVFAQFDIDPREIFQNFGATVAAIFDKATAIVEWSAGYIVIGAVVVLPIWGIAALLNALGKRKKSQ